MESTSQTADMGRTSIQVSEELADELYDRKERGESYEDVIWRLIDSADAGVQDPEPEGERGIAARSAANVREQLDDEQSGGDSATVRGHGHVDDARRRVHEIDLPGSGDVQQRREAGVLELYAHLMENEGGVVETQELKEQIDADDVDYASVDSFWSNCLKSSGDRPNALAALPGVEELGNGRYKYEEPEDDGA